MNGPFPHFFYYSAFPLAEFYATLSYAIFRALLVNQSSNAFNRRALDKKKMNQNFHKNESDIYRRSQDTQD